MNVYECDELMVVCYLFLNVNKLYYYTICNMTTTRVATYIVIYVV